MTQILNRIKTHAISRPSEEVCGFIVELDGNISVKECKNISTTPESKFEIHPEAYLSTKLESDILAIYHSHPNKESFSQTDKIMSRINCLPSVLYIIEKDEFEAFYPDLCREYKIDKIKDIING